MTLREALERKLALHAEGRRGRCVWCSFPKMEPVKWPCRTALADMQILDDGDANLDEEVTQEHADWLLNYFMGPPPRPNRLTRWPVPRTVWRHDEREDI